MDREFANYKPPVPKQTQNGKAVAAKSSTPSPEIEEERKTSNGKRPQTGRSVTFKEEQFPSGRDEVQREQMRQDEFRKHHFNQGISHHYSAPKEDIYNPQAS